MTRFDAVFDVLKPTVAEGSISDAEIEAIHRAWAEDLIQQNQREYISE